jgi:aldehyde:ferredoxin oxidoreductase
MFGYAGHILNVDLTSGKTSKSDLGTLGLSYLGGSGLGTRLLYDNFTPGANPLSPQNVLVMSPGFLTGLLVPTASKTLFCGKSPLTNTFCESSIGGPIGVELRHSGYDALVITGKAEDPTSLIIKDDNIDLVQSDNLWGKNTREASDALKKEHDVTVATIGMGGEKLVRFAGIDCEERQAGRGGLGAVMGSKNLKAIGIRGTGNIDVKEPKKLLETCLEWVKVMVDSAGFQEDTKYGTGEFLNWINEERGAFPTRNWQLSFFENRKHIDPYYWAPKYSKKNKACYSCVKPCGKLFTIAEGKYAGTVLDGVEYETLYSLGSNLENPDIEVLAKCNELCDLYGIDTISTGGVIGFAFELFERGLLTKEDTGGIELAFGKPDILPSLVEKIGRRKGIGDLMAEGVRNVAAKVGKGAENYAVHVKGMEPPAYDVRGIKGLGLGFMTSPRGACHLRSCAYALELTGKFWKFKDVDRFSSEGKGQEIKDMEDLMTAYDCLGVCKFSRGYFLANGFEKIFECIDGRTMDENEVLRIGERVNNLKHMFNLREGVKKADFLLPPRLTGEPVKEGPSEGNVITDEEMHKMLIEYFMARGWDPDGNITKHKLNELGLQ